MPRYDTALGMERLYPTPGPRLCAWCWGPLPKGKRRWCGDKCLDPALHIYLILKGHSETIRRAIFERDRGICSRCKLDTVAEEAYWREVFTIWEEVARAHFEELYRRNGYPSSEERHREWLIQQRAHGDARQYWQKATGLRELYSHRWEAHHKLAVIEGGGGCGLDGYETLCLPCHKIENRALAVRLAARRKLDRRK